jgi:sugar lactone lactonase YvrE
MTLASLILSLRSRVALACAILTFPTAGGSLAAAADPVWPQFRGPQSRGVAPDDHLPERWSSIENVAWKADVPGRGWSSPIVVGQRVIVTTVVNLGESEAPKKGLYFGGERLTPPTSEHQWKVVCLDLASGQPVWETTVHAGQPESSIHLKNSFASETPVTDGQHVYAYFGNLGLFCLDLDGKLVWEKPFTAHRTRFGWGTAASPVLFENQLFVVDDNEEESFVVSLDKRTGEELWKVARDEKSNWSTPYVWQNDVRTELVTAGTAQVRSYDLQGNLLWTLSGMSSITIATPYASDGLLYISSGYVLDALRPIYAIRPGASGDISLEEGETANEWIAWSNRQAAPYNPSTLLYDGRLYVLYDRGFFACFDAASGRSIYDRQRIPGGGNFTASPWAYQGKVFCLDEDGVTNVFQAGGAFHLLHKNPLASDDMGMATPAVAGDRLLIRTSARIYCLRENALVGQPVFAEKTPTRLLERGAGEGPAWHPEQGLFFSGENRIGRWDAGGTLHTFREQAGTNGLLFDRQGRLLACEPGQRRVTRTDLATGNIEVLADQYEGKPFNQPNDITIDSQGRIYFSDPRYGDREGLEIRDANGRAIEGVYRIDTDGSVSRIIAHEVDRPNGVEVSADDRYLFVADNNNNTVGGARKLWRFVLQADGTLDLSSQQLVFDWKTGRGPDGLTMDELGRLYVAGGRNEAVPPYETAGDFKAGVYVLTVDGQLLDFLPIPHDEVTNCAFGGDDLRSLYITAGGTLWSVRTMTPATR